jgi:hypothetical protein
MQRSMTGWLGTGAGSRELVTGWGAMQERGRAGLESGEVR